MESIKCNLCRKTKPSNEFLKNGKTLKSCGTCRDKNKTVKEPVALPVKEPPVKDLVPNKELIQLPLLEPIHEVINEIVPIQPIMKGWKRLSGKWIKEKTELELHQELTKKMNRQFTKRSAFPIHQYLMKYVFVDIRDL
jgi:hypothetical protein